MKTYTVEEISQIVGGILTKVQDTVITRVAPPKLADENTLALALSAPCTQWRWIPGTMTRYFDNNANKLSGVWVY